MNTAILLIGGNLGDRVANLQEAVSRIDRIAGKVVKTSALYETAPWGNVQQPDYLNQALEVETSLDALPLLRTLLEIETEIGRIRRQKWGARVIDIDMIFFNQEVIDLPELKVPHPRMAARQFVLVPLQEIIPHWVHPVLQEDITTLLAQCPDELPAKKLDIQAH
ncbi:2-amino-4-hydroxy-6-hydroxymethyldihydropteridine diphosphokinase [Chitinophaga pendula]|uniref:2-amino-4-hydroxy-6- hydroxymethyldihydropteridine diphosphokinase n=1 Tax=Chitinophaga TaxID=79328 RepID=UPI000BAFEF72|nr:MULTISPECIES: 2-amino-4-hydroxy-6-hydroxymethyldihydropteridine diphosphokinase [Chitinophaga]ASZ12076.1 2-amino-4-hydroxy-6-hydroxymethyldihydropteridine diphosphokinase [Chitinophaga sp. MD30]UCJ04886.1 2-amino-4-hydroxy-6-hydroxymethyldihydropteridine diphosphokinase [Chitinophaga pendula]